MPENYQHLRIEREPISNNRRTRRMNLPFQGRTDKRKHGQQLSEQLTASVAKLISSEGSKLEQYILKIKYRGSLDIQHLSKHGINFISQEDDYICAVFADENGLSKFSNHLDMLGANEDDLTYKQILEAVDGISNWDEQDRTSWAISQYGMPEDVEIFRLDVELWPIQVAFHSDRQLLMSNFEKWLVQCEISLIDKINLDSLLMYRVEVTASMASLLLQNKDIRLVDLLPSTGVTLKALHHDINEIPENIERPNSTSPRICILDSGVNTNHPLLAPAIGEAESFIPGEDSYDSVGHGTAVAGIALYGDLDACRSSNFWQPELLLFSGKILNKDNEYDDKTIETILIEAVNYFYQEHQCRVFNLSIGNQNAPYDDKHIRGVAYILDKLSRDLGVLFVVSAGNFNGSSSPCVPPRNWKEDYPEYLLVEQNALIDPAPALNVITVGSLAKHNATFDTQRYQGIEHISPANEGQPSPFTRHGPSVKGAIKPELMAYGGNLATPMRQVDGYAQETDRGLGVLTLNHEFVGNTLFSEFSGTSFAAPYVTHLIGRILSSYPDASSNLLRALLINHSRVSTLMESTFADELKTTYNEQYGRNAVRDVGGYGSVDEDTLYRSTENAVVLLSEDSITNNTHNFYELPLPEDFLRSNRAAREIVISLAYTPHVRTTRLDYVATKISFKLVRGESLDDVECAFNNANKDTYDNIPECSNSNRTVTETLRSKGTVQCSHWLYKQLKPKHKYFVVVTRQDRDWGESLSKQLEDYGLVISLTDRENEEARLYSQIRERIEQKQRARATN